MNHINKILKILQLHFECDKRRVTFIASFVVSLVRARTVTLSNLSVIFNPKVKSESNYRRIQRFFEDFVMDYLHVAKLVISSLPHVNFILTLDRTNWQFGRKDINVLMLALVYKNISIPLCWELLNKRGNSSFEERKDIVSKGLTILGKSRIKCLVADREFGSGRFFRYLKKAGINFHIRIKKTSVITRYKSKVSDVTSMLSNLKIFKYIVLPGKKIVYNEEVYLSGMKTLKNDYVIIASSSNPEEAQAMYKQRWTIENLFGNMKTKGFNLESTHMRDDEKLKKLIALLTIALLWCYLIGLWIESSIKIRIKNHGRKEKSTFRKGLDHFTKILNSFEKLIFETDCVFKVLSCT
jgi:hypothetical protein